MVLVHWLGSVDHIWHTALDLGTSTCLVQGTWCKKYKIKIADCIYTHTIYILAWKITGSFGFEPIRTGSQNCWPLQTSNWTISPVLPQAWTLGRTKVRFCCIQVRTMVPNWTLPSLSTLPLFLYLQLTFIVWSPYLGAHEILIQSLLVTEFTISLFRSLPHVIWLHTLSLHHSFLPPLLCNIYSITHIIKKNSTCGS